MDGLFGWRQCFLQATQSCRVSIGIYEDIPDNGEAHGK